MVYKNMLIAVKDHEKAKQFYKDIFGLEVVEDFGACVTLTGGLGLQTAETWEKFINKTSADIVYFNNATELYFEEDDIFAFMKKLETRKDIVFLHPLMEQSWGQYSVRFYDLDGHIIEVGENMRAVIKRFIDSGLSHPEIAIRMDVPVDYVEEIISQFTQ